MDTLELSVKSAELANKDAEFKKSIQGITTSILMVLKNGTTTYLYISIENGEVKSIRENKEGEFVIEMSMKDYDDLLRGKTSGLELMAFGKLKLVKGSLEGIGKIASAFSAMTDFSQKVLESEK